MKRKVILTRAPTLMSPEDRMISEISQTQEDKYYMIPLICSQIVETRSRQCVPGAGGGNGELVFNGDRAPVWENEKMLRVLAVAARRRERA